MDEWLKRLVTGPYFWIVFAALLVVAGALTGVRP
jgi:hypothetical protein